MDKIQALLFDMDGVLVDAKDWHYEALNYALSFFGMEIARDAHLAVFDGLPTKTKLKMLAKTRSLPEGLHSFINEVKQKRTMEIALANCRPVFHHQYALSRFRDNGFRIAVCSNSIRPTIETILERSDLMQYVDLYLSAEDVTRAKPDPEIYVTAAERLRIPTRNCLVIEDNENGIAAARASGAHVLEVADVEETNFERIMACIRSIENAQVERIAS